MAKKKLSPEDLLRLRSVEDPQISPDGSRIVFVRCEMNGPKNCYERRLWIADFTKGRPRQLTSGPGAGEIQPRWSPDGGKIAFVSSRTGNPQIFTIDLDGGEARQITHLVRGAGNPAWSPDGSSIAFTARVSKQEGMDVVKGRGREMKDAHGRAEPPPPDPEPDPRVVDRIMYREGTAYKDDRHSQIFILPASGRGRPRQISRGEYSHSAPLWGPGGQTLLTTSNRNGHEDEDIVANIVSFSVKTGREKILTDNSDSCMGLTLSPDESRLLFIARPGEKIFAHNQTLRAFDFRSGKTTVLTPSFDGDVEVAVSLASTKEILFLAEMEGERRLYLLPPEGGVCHVLPTGASWIESFTTAQDRLAYASSSPVHPPDLFTLDATGLERRVTNLNQALLKPYNLAPPEEIRFNGHGGLPIQGWYLAPPGKANPKRRPLILQIHGGPHVMWGWQFHFEFQMLASQGFGVFFCNPRGSLGYGVKFKGKLFKKWAVDDAKDVLLGVEEVVRRGLADPEKLYITGGSYGGFLTAWIIGRDQRFRAAIVQRGVYNLVSFYGCSDVQMLIEWEFEAYPWDAHAFYWKHSPLAYVNAIKTPTLILHAELDYRAPISTAEEFFMALRKLGRDVRFVRYPREGHELSRSGEPRHRVDRCRRILEWFQNHPS